MPKINFASDHRSLAVSFSLRSKKKKILGDTKRSPYVLIADGSHGELQPEEFQVRRLP